jgi:hypothetical protein
MKAVTTMVGWEPINVEKVIGLIKAFYMELANDEGGTGMVEVYSLTKERMSKSL